MIGYLDESGSHGFDFSKVGTSRYFVVTAIIINPQNHDMVIEMFTKIKNQYFPISEMKSSKIGNNEGRRIEILNKLLELDFKFHTLIVDKKRIDINSGLTYKEPFYKFLYGILYSDLYRTFPELQLIADSLISEEFTKSFQSYVNLNHKVDLFTKQKLTFHNSEQSILLQLSDIIGGTISRYYSGKSLIDPIDLLNSKLIKKTIWPDNFQEIFVEVNDDGNQFEDIISKLSILRVETYLDKNRNSSDNTTRARVMFLTYLKNNFLFNNRNRYITTQELIEYLSPHFEEKIKEQFLRQQIVGPLRNEGVLLVSNSNGYKIPSTKNDVLRFFNLFNRIISPMLSRLHTTHLALYGATNGELDVLNYPEFELLKRSFEK